QKNHRQRISFLAGRTTRHPNAHGLIRVAVFDQLWEDVFFEHLEYFRVSEEARDVDQHILVEGLDFLFVVAQIAYVRPEIWYLVEDHSPGDAPVKCGALVQAQIRSGY